MSSDFDFGFAPNSTPENGRDVYTPTRLNREARTLLERGLPALWLEGEISNFSRPSSGHWYFSLKDEGAQLRCAMFRQRNLLARFKPQDGVRVQARGRVSLYEPRGDYQFIVDHIEEAGEGALRRKFELLKNRLAAEGLFAVERKQPLPKLPKRIGVITSPTGAAVRDVLHILRRRFCTIPILIYPVPVQGATAAAHIAAMIRTASQRAECDVLILARGGGSLEDLWAFNEEVVARAIYDCAIPIVSGVGHEVDFTIADFVADVRAPTPSGAAEIVAPDCAEWGRVVTGLARRLQQGAVRRIANSAQRMAWLERRLGLLHPGVQLRQHAQRLDELEQRLGRSLQSRLSQHRSLIAQLGAHLRQHSPALMVATGFRRLENASSTLRSAMSNRLSQRRASVTHLAAQLRHHSPALMVAMSYRRLESAANILRSAISQELQRSRHRLKVAAGTLDVVSPLRTLERGYAIVTAENHVITDAATLQPGDRIKARLADGSLEAIVEHVDPNKPASPLNE
jgi:exodeoxyribonuclease VII large subunit